MDDATGLEVIKKQLEDDEIILPKRVVSFTILTIIFGLSSASWVVFRKHLGYPSGNWIYMLTFLFFSTGCLVCGLIFSRNIVTTDYGRVFSLKTGKCIDGPFGAE